MYLSQMPRVALISDIHSNIDALRSVLADIETQDIDKIVCLGDIIGYGAAPAECLSLIRQRCFATVQGNHDEFLVKGLEKFVLGKRLGDPIRHAKETVFAGDLKWLGRQPLSSELHGFTIVHGSLHHPEAFDYLNTDITARCHFEEQKTPVCFFGHTHRPEVIMLHREQIRWGLLHEGDVLLDRSHPCAINVGSVGQPRDDDPRAGYGIIDTEMGLFTLRRVAYDIDMAIQRIREAGLPEENGLRLLKGE
ncbi:MAG: metallophosphoesterase [Proteobacteria bacterium]|nr:metallophosphoesterase [Pseudomonadota bacterium]